MAPIVRIRYRRHSLLRGLNRCGKGGIGEALVHEYAQKGIHAIATVLPSEKSDHLDGLTSVSWFTLDVTEESSIRQLLKNISQLTDGYLDVLVNNA